MEDKHLEEQINKVEKELADLMADVNGKPQLSGRLVEIAQNAIKALFIENN